MIAALERISGQRNGASILGLGPAQIADLEINQQLRSAPTTRAIDVYTGVLFGELDYASLSDSARRRADSTLAIASSVFGLVRPTDLIPAYRLAGSVTLPRLGTVASRWKPQLPAVIENLAGGGLIVDLRSGTYVNFGKVAGAMSMRVLNENDGKRTVVSHFNKATKGQIVRQLLNSGVDANSIDELAVALKDLGWQVEHPKPHQLDVILI